MNIENLILFTFGVATGFVSALLGLLFISVT